MTFNHVVQGSIPAGRTILKQPCRPSPRSPFFDHRLSIPAHRLDRLRDGDHACRLTGSAGRLARLLLRLADLYRLFGLPLLILAVTGVSPRVAFRVPVRTGTASTVFAALNFPNPLGQFRDRRRPSGGCSDSPSFNWSRRSVQLVLVCLVGERLAQPGLVIAELALLDGDIGLQVPAIVPRSRRPAVPARSARHAGRDCPASAAPGTGRRHRGRPPSRPAGAG